ncbi:XRE family transcriptional regulator [Pseudovibrio sp. POLY-S9]|uniref:XRE family transcriptional regulator n=1 Tax=Pseudovibrio sp. POLY-S9 TaxID=1576596 RepID=UPI00070C345C|nr:XRE family transcriptional regulator [Pseudovibrio sp. POLY-S9]
MFNHKRLDLARRRRRLTNKKLSEVTGLTVVTLTRILRGITETPSEESVEKLARALDYPTSFFYGEDFETLNPDGVSFRSLKRMSAKERDAAIAAGELGVELFHWLDQHFNLPTLDLPDLSDSPTPEIAAAELRQHWKLGEKPIGNMVHLLESKGVHVLSLSERNNNVDAFSFWLDKQPFVFLNTQKTAEHSIYDAGHELGHLVLHKLGDLHDHRQIEHEANQFSAAFLMPEKDVRSAIRRPITPEKIIKSKKRWRVSAMALTYRLHKLAFISDWQYRSMCIELGRRGYRSGEPDGIKRETSKVWELALTQLWREKKTTNHIAQETEIPLDELDYLMFSPNGSKEKTKTSFVGLKLAQDM